MQKRFSILAISAALSVMTGCSHHHPDPHRVKVYYEGEYVEKHHGHPHDNHNEHHYKKLSLKRVDSDGNILTSNSSSNLSAHPWMPPAGSFSPRVSHKLINDYAEQISLKLVENLRGLNHAGLVAVASFVELDAKLKNTNMLGNQLSESFITELQEFGMSVVDFKTTNSIRVTKQGDFVFSRDFEELQAHQAIDFVLSGTLSYTDRGVIVNARIIGLKDKVVVSSAQGFIPHFVVQSMYPSAYRTNNRTL